jgi:two-component system LytT family response regulator
VILLKPEEIDWIEADGDYMKFHVGGKTLLQRETMAALEARLDPALDPARFRRIHRSMIINLDRVAHLSPAFNGDHVVILKDGTRLRLSKGYQDRLHDWLRPARPPVQRPGRSVNVTSKPSWRIQFET